ncbi:MAG: rhodanese-like domain-containing protein [Actinomycetota bacterium]
MLSKWTLPELPFEEALAHHDEGAAWVDLRSVDAYLDVHLPGALALLYEFGPGMASRARDCIPLGLPLMLLDADNADMTHAAASLKGKGFEVVGRVADGINRWAEARSAPASTEILQGSSPQGAVLDVADPGARPGEGALSIPIERLWGRVGELAEHERVTIASGYGVRAALAVGILERAALQVVYWRSAPDRAGP